MSLLCLKSGSCLAELLEDVVPSKNEIAIGIHDQDCDIKDTEGTECKSRITHGNCIPLSNKAYIVMTTKRYFMHMMHVWVSVRHLSKCRVHYSGTLMCEAPSLVPFWENLRSHLIRCLSVTWTSGWHGSHGGSLFRTGIKFFSQITYVGRTWFLC